MCLDLEVEFLRLSESRCSEQEEEKQLPPEGFILSVLLCFVLLLLFILGGWVCIVFNFTVQFNPPRVLQQVNHPQEELLLHPNEIFDVFLISEVILAPQNQNPHNHPNHQNLRDQQA